MTDVSSVKEWEKEVFLPADEEIKGNTNEAHQILHIVVLFQIFVIFIVRSLTILSCDSFV